MRKIKMDIRQFAVPAPLIGSIEANSGYGAPPLSGQEIHVLIQRKLERENPEFVAEKPFKLTLELKNFNLIINGRADGFINSHDNNASQIIEIKTAFDIDELKAKLEALRNHPYVWQLRTYGYIHYKATGEIPDLLLKLVSSRNIKKFIDINIFLEVEDYEKWLDLRLEEIKRDVLTKEKIFAYRKNIAETMAFPFDRPRQGQTELVETVLQSFERESPVMLQAPTGLGKTAGVLYPALKEAFSRGQKVVYVTPKNSQHLVAEEAVDHINRMGSKVRRLTLTSKSKMCFKAEPLCNPKYCEYAHNYYQKLSSHDLVNKLGKMKSLSSKKITKLAEEFQVCPFELSLEAIAHTDVVIGDYNYVFSRRSLIGKLSTPLLELELANLVIDEAHNLPARAQDYFSPQISLHFILEIEGALMHLPKYYSNKALNLTAELKALIMSYGEGSVTRRISIDPAPFNELDFRVREFTLKYLEADTDIEPQDPVLKLSNYLSEFTAALELSGEEFFQTYQRSTNNELLKITCADASKQLAQAYKEFKNTAAFSATLKPFNYYQELLGLPVRETKTFEFASPFLVENRKIVMIPQISTKYKDRHVSAPKICEVLEKILPLKLGNYMALFPSFEFMNQVERMLGQTSLPGYDLLVQEKKMTAKKTASFLEQLKSEARPTLLLGVQGGIFSEGVDYPGNMLIGVFVIGPALPNFDFEREQIRAYYENRYGREQAFNYAYVFPAMARAIQSAGRVIRTETDRGLIVLIDPRFLENSYAETMPKEWFIQSPHELLSQKILADISLFWDRGNKA